MDSSTLSFLRIQQQLVEQDLAPIGFIGGPYLPRGKHQTEAPVDSIEGLIQEPDSIDFIRLSSSPSPYGAEMDHRLSPFESACVHGPLSTVQSIMASEDLTEVSLHRGLSFAIDVGNVEVVDCLLAGGARIAHSTGSRVLCAPADRQIPLFELLIAQTRWTPNTRDQNGFVMLPDVVKNMPLLRWFLANGANPNFGFRRGPPGIEDGPIVDSAQALEAAAAKGPLEAVQMLLDAGAQVKNGTPLHSAAGAAYVAGTDDDRIPIMELLVSLGADVNEERYTRYVTPSYPLVCAVEAEAPARVKWLLDHGANPHLVGNTRSAIKAASYRDEEMKRIVEEGVIAQKWMQNVS